MMRLGPVQQDRVIEGVPPIKERHTNDVKTEEVASSKFPARIVKSDGSSFSNDVTVREVDPSPPRAVPLPNVPSSSLTSKLVLTSSPSSSRVEPLRHLGRSSSV